MQLVLPASALANPALQFLHTVCPESFKYFPTSQAWHTPAAVCPAPALEYFPASQAWHWASDASPVRLDHLPGEQRPWHWASSVSPVEADHLPGEQPWHGVVRINTFTLQPFAVYLFPDVPRYPLPQSPPAEEPWFAP